jgi:hypothetical protein
MNNIERLCSGISSFNRPSVLGSALFCTVTVLAITGLRALHARNRPSDETDSTPTTSSSTAHSSALQNEESSPFPSTASLSGNLDATTLPPGENTPLSLLTPSLIAPNVPENDIEDDFVVVESSEETQPVLIQAPLSWAQPFNIFAESGFAKALREEGKARTFPDQVGSYTTCLKGLRRGILSSIDDWAPMKEATDSRSLSPMDQFLKSQEIGIIPASYLEKSYLIMTRPMLNTAKAILKPVVSGSSFPQHSLSQTITQDSSLIKRQMGMNQSEGVLNRAFNQLGAVANVFDPHLNGNTPFSIGKRQIGGKNVQMLRHANPSKEKIAVNTAGEYIGFLEHSKIHGKKVLYSTLLTPSNFTRDEKPRIAELMKLANSPRYQNTLYVNRFPLDGPLHELDSYNTLEEYATEIENRFTINTDTSDFMFSRNLEDVAYRNYRTVLKWALQEIQLKYPAEDRKVADVNYKAAQKQVAAAKKAVTQANSAVAWTFPTAPSTTRLKAAQQQLKNAKDALTQAKTQKEEPQKALMMLFCSVMTDKILTRQDIDFWNKTCKDAIDRGTAFALSDLIFNSALNGTLQENKENLRTLAAWPSFMAKTQPILPHRASWAQAFSNWADKTNSAELAASYEAELGMRQSPFVFDV